MSTAAVRPSPVAGLLIDRAWREEFLDLMLETDRRLVALDVRCWPRTVPGGMMSVIEHLQCLGERWRRVPRIAQVRFVPDGASTSRPDPTARAARPAAVLRSWRREGQMFPDRLTSSLSHSGLVDHAGRQYDAELTALRRCLTAANRAADADSASLLS